MLLIFNDRISINTYVIKKNNLNTYHLRISKNNDIPNLTLSKKNTLPEKECCRKITYTNIKHK